MLVLTRKREESIVIDGGIVIKILGVKSGQVRIGIEAPKKVGVRRGEIKPLQALLAKGSK